MQSTVKIKRISSKIYGENIRSFAQRAKLEIHTINLALEILKHLTSLRLEMISFSSIRNTIPQILWKLLSYQMNLSMHYKLKQSNFSLLSPIEISLNQFIQSHHLMLRICRNYWKLCHANKKKMYFLTQNPLFFNAFYMIFV